MDLEILLQYLGWAIAALTLLSNLIVSLRNSQKLDSNTQLTAATLLSNQSNVPTPDLSQHVNEAQKVIKESEGNP